MSDLSSLPDLAHPAGELPNLLFDGALSFPVDGCGKRFQVSWEAAMPVTALGDLVYFAEYLRTAGLLSGLLADCPLVYTSPNAPLKADVLGTAILSILAGYWRYVHTTRLTGDLVAPQFFGMSKVVSEDSLRRAFKDRLAPPVDYTAWLRRHLRHSYLPLLTEDYILDLDSTVKVLYGHQEGAEVGYNPQKPGRPSHVLHSYFIANLRLILEVSVQSGKRHAGCFGEAGLWSLLAEMPRDCWPTFVRGDIGYGHESLMCGCEERGVDYLCKLRQSKGVKGLIRQMALRPDWEPAGDGWQGLKATLQLQGWSRSRRVVLIRRPLPINPKSATARGGKKSKSQPSLPLIGQVQGHPGYEYAVLVTSMDLPVLTTKDHYRDRGDAENNFDELKNQWGWGGYTTRDLKRCQIMAHLTALVQNWWNTFVRLVVPHKHHEALTSRPLFQHSIGRLTRHAGQQVLQLCSSHGEAGEIQKKLTQASTFLKRVSANAEQLAGIGVWRYLLSAAFRYYLNNRLLRDPEKCLSG